MEDVYDFHLEMKHSQCNISLKFDKTNRDSIWLTRLCHSTTCARTVRQISGIGSSRNFMALGEP